MGLKSRSKRRWGGVLLLPLIVATTLGIAPSVEAREPAVTLGEITMSGRGRSELARTLRSALREELGSSEFARLGARDRYILSARLVTLESEPAPRSVRTTAVVSLILRQRKSESLHAVASGRATVQEAKSRVRDAEDAALRAAVHSGMSRVSKALTAKR